MVSRQGRRAVLGIFVAVVLALVCSQVPKAVSAEPFEGIMQAITGAAQGEPEPQAIDEAFGVDPEFGQVPPAALTANAGSVTSDADDVDPEMGVDAGDGEAASDDEANADEADRQQAVVPSAPSRSDYNSPAPFAVDESGVKVKLFDYVDNINTTGPAATAGKTNVNHAALLQSTSNWNPMDYYSAFQFNGRDNYEDDNPWNKWTGNGGDVRQGIVSSKLGSNGYPTFSQKVQNVMANNSEKDLAYLFTESSYAKQFGVINPDTFLSKNGNNYSFDSAKNFAEYDMDSGKMALKGPNQAAVANPNDNPQFAPFDKLPTNGSLSGSNANYAFGMTVEANFRQPQDGKVTKADGTKEDMVFNFSGDDDVWLYIDGALVLDIGGIHNVSSGSINFATGDVLVTGSGNQQHKTTLKAMMRGALGDQWVKENMEGNTFKDFSNHTMKFFYLERGHGGSNCKLDFNLETVPDGVIDIHKLITDSNTADFTDAQFMIRVDVAKSGDGSQPADKAYNPYKGKYQVYDAANNKVGDEQTTTDGTFTLKNGQYARLLDDIKATDWYKVTELAASGYDTNDYEFSLSGATVTTPGQGEVGQSNPVQVVKNPAATVGNKFTAKDKYAFVVDKKMADGQNAPVGATFTMHVTSGDNKVFTGKYYLSTEKSDKGDYTFNTSKQYDAKNGDIVLKAGQAAKIVDVDPNTTFNVEEKLADEQKGKYEAPSYEDNETDSNDKSEQQVVVNRANQTGTITVTNTLKPVAGFTIKKVVSGRDWKEGEKFSFTISKVGYAISAASNDFKTDEASLGLMPLPVDGDTVKMEKGDSKTENSYLVNMTFSQPGAYKYTVTEKPTEGQTDLDYSDAEYAVVIRVTRNETTGQLVTTTAVTQAKDDSGKEPNSNNPDSGTTATFTNSAKADLTLSKFVSGTAANKDEHFDFTVHGQGLTGSYEVVTKGNDGENAQTHPGQVASNQNGDITLQLKHGETATIKGLPAGSVVITESVTGKTITKTMAKVSDEQDEKDVTADAEKSFTDDLSVNLPAGSTEGKAVTVAFTNTTDMNPDLGIRSNATPFLAMAGTAGAAVAAAAAIRIRGRLKRD